jgi:hypothetical protein
VKIRFERVQLSIGRQEMARRGIPSAITDNDIEALARTLPKTKLNQVTGKKVVKSPTELRSEAKQKLAAKEAKQ